MPASPPAASAAAFKMPWGNMGAAPAAASSASPYQVELLPRTAKNPIQDELKPHVAPAMPASPPATAFEAFMPWGLKEQAPAASAPKAEALSKSAANDAPAEAVAPAAASKF